MEMHPDIPYRYQEEVFLRAQKDNIIAALNTGSGKTLISILLIKWIAAQEKSKGKAVIFLVPKVTLVDQQKETIQRQTSLKVTKLHGAVEMELSDREGWKKKFESYDVFVMTAQIFVNLITHGLWSMQQISLMIFDECHHARKNDPYNSILREYRHIAPPERPKIFGMTASPIWNVRNPLGSIKLLEDNMNAKVIGVRENIAELLEKSPRPEERLVEYPFPLEEYDHNPFAMLHQALRVFDQAVWDDLGIPLYSILDTRYQTTFYNLGPYCASLFLYLEIQYLMDGVLLARQQGSAGDFDVSLDNSGIKTSKPLPDETPLILDILHDFSSFFPPNMSSQAVPIPISLDWCTPKVKVLAAIILEYFSKSPTFQCIIFVEQRQIASTLSKILPAIPELEGKVKTAFLVGQGVNSEGVSKQTDQYHGDAVKQFRNGEINILIATSVAEEGLDFKECDLVIRFDGLHHMVAYVQSRGRARKKASTFILMIEQGHEVQHSKYLALRDREDEVTQVYRDRHSAVENDDDDDSIGDEEYSADLVERERYVVKSTGAVLTYDNSIQLLSNLCSLIPRDAFTALHKPKFTGDSQSTLYLPRAIPVSSEDLVYVGPLKRSKQEARRAVAFMAVQRLRELDVFDEYLLPTSNEPKDKNTPLMQHMGGKQAPREVPAIMTVSVRDPWCMGEQMWLHPVVVDGRAVAGVVTGTNLPPAEVMVSASSAHILPGVPIRFDEGLEAGQLRAMEEFTRLGIRYFITAKSLLGVPSLYLIPITAEYQPDFKAIELLLANPAGIKDWSHVTDDDYEKLMIMSLDRLQSVHILRRIRDDLTPMSAPPEGSRESDYPTFHQYWVAKWSSKTRMASVPTDGPVLEAVVVRRIDMGLRSLQPAEEDILPVHTVRYGCLLPLKHCVWLPISLDILKAYQLLPPLAQRITNLYRARCARYEIKLPSLPDDLFIEVFTLPSAGLSFSNQRLETLGDAVLQLCTTVHLLNQYPTRHEGQLTKLRQKIVSNRYLMQRALDVGLEHYINSEMRTMHKWRYILTDEVRTAVDASVLPSRYVDREYPRRSLQDCMEAILGASFVVGGISTVLQTGTVLGLEFGGPLPWFMRYSQRTPPGGVSPLFAILEEKLGYKFNHNHLVLEALTHPSFATPTEGPSYQRLEFLGDAILDIVVSKYLYDKFPQATSHQLSYARQKVICTQTLAYLAVNRLGLHKMMLVNSLDLNSAIDRCVPILESLSAEDIVKNGWKYDPPKAVSDVFESVMGAVLVDSEYDYEKTAAVMEYVMDDVLEILTPDLGKDPVSTLLEWAAANGCTAVAFEKRMKKTSNNEEREGYVVLVHGDVLVGPIVATSLPVAKGVAGERALAILRDNPSEKSLHNLCACKMVMQVDSLSISEAQDSDIADVEEVVNILSQDGEGPMEL